MPANSDTGGRESGKGGTVRHQSPAAGDTNSRKRLQVAGIQGLPVAPLDQESPGSSAGGATESSATKFVEVAGALGGVSTRVQAWLHEPVQALRGRTPLRMITQGDAAKVLTLLANIDAGVFD